MGILQSIILGIVEGFTEFLPISSTAHLLLSTKALGITETEFVKSFVIVIQLGAILGIVTLYFKKLLTDWDTNKKILLAFLPTAVIGFVLYKIIKGFLFENFYIMATALILGGIVLIWIERRAKTAPDPDSSKSYKVEAISYKQAFLIGCIQSLAVIPGVSRAGATIVGGLLLGVSREAIITFSFLLAVPTMLAATGYDLLKTGFALNGSQYGLIAIGFVFAYVFAILGVKFLLKIISTKSLAPFGVYRIILGVAMFAQLIIYNYK